MCSSVANVCIVGTAKNLSGCLYRETVDGRVETKSCDDDANEDD